MRAMSGIYDTSGVFLHNQKLAKATGWHGCIEAAVMLHQRGQEKVTRKSSIMLCRSVRGGVWEGGGWGILL